MCDQIIIYFVNNVTRHTALTHAKEYKHCNDRTIKEYLIMCQLQLFYL